MKERPILFSAPMVRALLDGSKTQTRRTIRPQPTHPLYRCVELWFDDPDYSVGAWKAVRCPTACLATGSTFGEAWAQNENQLSETWMDRSLVYRADGGPRALDNGGEKPWRPSIHMPRWASRITLEVTDVRVERLQDISEIDAMAEGSEPLLVPPDGGSAPHVVGFANLWESTGGDWEANPWIWVVAFRRALVMSECLILEVSDIDQWEPFRGCKRIRGAPTVLHPSRPVAETEAMRLAQAHPDKVFAIFEVKAVVHSVQVPSHMTLGGQIFATTRIAEVDEDDGIPF